MRMRSWLCGAAVALGVLVVAPVASADVFPVVTTDDGEDAVPGDGQCSTLVNPRCTLRAAIEESNALLGPDRVNLPPGTYSLGPLGELDVSSSIVVEATGTASNTVIRKEGGASRIFEVTPAGTLDLRDATVRDGVLAAEGGGILSQGTLVLRRAVVANNEANNENGGGIAILNPASGNTTILDSTIGSPGGGVAGNRAGGTGSTTAFGGGIYHEDGTLTIRDSTIVGNRVDATPGSGAPEASAGAIYTEGPLTIEDTTIRSNRARADAAGAATAGGVLHTEGQLSIRRSTIAQNEADAVGFFASSGVGGILTETPGVIEDTSISANLASSNAGIAYVPTSPAQTLTVRRSAIAGNMSGGMLATGRVVLESSTLSGNGFGPGLLSGADGVIRGSTIAAHGAQAGISVGGPVSVVVTGSILSGNSPNCEEQTGASIESGGGNVESANSCGFSAAGDQPNTNPLLGPLASNGGPTQTRALASNSPARDAVTGGCPPPSTDQRGVARPQGPRCDSGAFEIAVSPPPPPPPPAGGELDLSLSGKGKQKVKRLAVNVSCGEVACSVELRGKGRVPTSGSSAAAAAKAKKFKLKRKSADVAAGETETVRLKFRKHRKTVKKVRGLLKRGGKKTRKRSKVTVNAEATAAGKTETAKQKIKLKR